MLSENRERVVREIPETKRAFAGREEGAKRYLAADSWRLDWHELL